MTVRSRLSFGGLVCVGAILMSAAIAQATRLTINGGGLSHVWNPLTVDIAGVDVECPASLFGAYHEISIIKTAGALIGVIDDADIDGACIGGTIRFPQESLPWHRVYMGYNGTLPRLTGFKGATVGQRMSIQTEVATCEALTTTAEPARGTESVEGGGYVTSYVLDASGAIDLAGGFFCDIAGDMTLAGTAAVAEGIRITLV